jgi:hypothetical protein
MYSYSLLSGPAELPVQLAVRDRHGCDVSQGRWSFWGRIGRNSYGGRMVVGRCEVPRQMLPDRTLYALN